MSHRKLPRIPGRTLVCGDLHGMRDLLMRELERVGFRPSIDRLVCTGDLVDRGLDSLRTAELLAEPWFFSVMGNHDFVAAADAVENGRKRWDVPHAFEIGNTDPLPRGDRGDKARELLAAMPLTITIETGTDLVGIVHGDAPRTAWSDTVMCLEKGWPINGESARDIHTALWGDDEMRASTCSIAGVEACIHGHHTDENLKLIRKGNRHYIDTGAWMLQPEIMDRWPLRTKPRLTIVEASDPDSPL